MNKEEIKKAKECLNEIIQNTYTEGKTIKLDNLRKYIEQLENKASVLNKVTDKLEKTRRELDDDGGGYYAQKITKILNIIEGEKQQ